MTDGAVLKDEMFAKAPSGQRLAAFYRGLSVVYNSGVRLDNALLCLHYKDEPDPLTPALHRAWCYLRSGLPFWKSLKFSGAFPDMHIQLIRVGEYTGTLDVALDGLANNQERSAAVEAKVKSALTYPIIMLCVCLVALLAIPGLLFTPIFEFLEKSQVTIPWISQVVLFFLGLLGKPTTWLCLAVGAALVFTGLRRSKRLKFTTKMERVLLRLPVAGKTWQQLVTARFLRSLEPAVSSGCPLLTAFEMAGASAGSPVVAGQVRRLVSEVRGGAPLETGLLKFDFISASYLHALIVGVESGRLDTMLGSVASLVELEFESALESLVSLLEPIAMLGIGLIVGLVIAATMSPMLELIRSLS